jgi:hypothetical protein
MYSTNLINETKKEYFIVGNDYPNKIGEILLRLERMGWDLRLDNIYIHRGNKPQRFIQI